MIAYITWEIIDVDFTNVTILTNSGLGYDIWINELTYTRLDFWEEVGLFIHHIKTENAESLYWFLDKEEKKVFWELIKISWIWWKWAMQILGVWVERLLLAIQAWDNKTIEWIKWIWKKMAEKIILELKDKDFGINLSSRETAIKASNISPDLHSSIKSTLSNMWYNPRDIDRVLSELPDWMNNASEIIPFVIKELS